MEFNLISKGVSFLDEAQFDTFVSEAKRSTGKPKIVLFCSYEFGLDFITQNAGYLSEKFDLYKIYTNAAMEIPENAHFKAVISIKRNFYLLKRIIKDCNFDLAIIANIGLNYHWYAPFFREFCEVKTVVIEKDFTTMVHCQKADVFSDYMDSTVDRFNFERDCEKYALEQCDGIITNMGGDFFENVVLEKSKRSIFYIPFRDPSLYRYENIDFRNSNKIVYCGTMEPADTQKEYGREGDFYSIFEDLLSIGFEIDAYSLVDIERLAGYHSLGVNFKLFKAMEVHRLINAIKNSRFGSMIVNTALINNELKEPMKYLFPTKLFTYLAAGLPIIINNEYGAVRRWIEDNGVGFGVCIDSLRNDNRIKSDEVWRTMLSGVKTFQAAGMYFAQQTKLGNFLEETIRG